MDGRNSFVIKYWNIACVSVPEWMGKDEFSDN